MVERQLVLYACRYNLNGYRGSVTVSDVHTYYFTIIFLDTLDYLRVRVMF